MAYFSVNARFGCIKFKKIVTGCTFIKNKSRFALQYDMFTKFCSIE